MEAKKAQAKFKFKVNNTIYEIDIECPTGYEILNKAGYEEPGNYDLILIRKGKEEMIAQDQTVCFEPLPFWHHQLLNLIQL